MSSSKLNVVIVGASDSARYLAYNLNKNRRARAAIDLTVISANTFSEIPWYSTVSLTRPGEFTKNSTRAPIEDLDNVVYGVAESTTDGEVHCRLLPTPTESIQKIPFDILVAATGSNIPLIRPLPGQSLIERKKEIHYFQELLISSTNELAGRFVISGGGAIGVELAADIQEMINKQSSSDGNNKGVTLISRNPRLVSDQSKVYSDKVEHHLKSIGVEIIKSNEVISHKENTFVSSLNGKGDNERIKIILKDNSVIDNCIGYVCAYSGSGSNTSWLRKSIIENINGENPLPNINEVFNEKNQICVNSFLQSKVCPKLFAIGQTSDLDAPGIIPFIEEQAKTIAHNISSIALTSSTKYDSSLILPNKSFKKYKPPLPINSPLYIKVGHDNHTILIADNFPLGNVFLKWCGYPFNLCCFPCLGCGAIFGIVDPMVCGKCCEDPEGKGLAKTMQNLKDREILAKRAGYFGLGSTTDVETPLLPQNIQMER